MTDKIINAYKENEKLIAEQKPTLGYTGHLIEIANMIIDLSSDKNYKQLIAEQKGWKQFAITVLKDITKLQNTDLGGPRPKRKSGGTFKFDEDIDDEVCTEIINQVTFETVIQG